MSSYLSYYYEEVSKNPGQLYNRNYVVQYAWREIYRYSLALIARVMYRKRLSNKKISCHYCGEQMEFDKMMNHYDINSSNELLESTCYGGIVLKNIDHHYRTRMDFYESDINWSCVCEACTVCKASNRDDCILCSFDRYKYRNSVIDKRNRYDIDNGLNCIYSNYKFPRTGKENKSADIFAMMVLISDDYMKINPPEVITIEPLKRMIREKPRDLSKESLNIKIAWLQRIILCLTKLIIFLAIILYNNAIRINKN